MSNKLFSNLLWENINLIVGIVLGAGAIYFLFKISDKVELAYTIEGAKGLSYSVEEFHKKNGKYPENLLELKGEDWQPALGFYIYKSHSDSFEICAIEMRSNSIIISNSSRDSKNGSLDDCLNIAKGGSWTSN